MPHRAGIHGDRYDVGRNVWGREWIPRGLGVLRNDLTDRDPAALSMTARSLWSNESSARILISSSLAGGKTWEAHG